MDIGRVVPAARVGDFHDGERPITMHDPWEVDDMRDFYERSCVSRHIAGHGQYGESSCHKSPLESVRGAIEEGADGLFYLRQAERALSPQDGRLRVYLFGPYRANTPKAVDANIAMARRAAGAVLRRGHCPFTPHLLTAAFERHFPDIADDVYLTTDLDWLPVCHAMLALPGWDKSRGSLEELRVGETLGLFIVDSASELPTPEEVRQAWPPTTS